MIATARRRALFLVSLIGVAGAFLLPQLWLFSLSLKNKAGLFEYPPTWLPRGGSLANYRFVLTHSQVPWYLWNSMVVATFASAATLAVAVPEPTSCRATASAGGGRCSRRCSSCSWCRR